MSRVSKLLLLAAFMATASSVSSAQSLTGNVGSANIATGERAAEVRVGLDDEHVARARLHYEQAFTEWYQLRAITSFRKRDGESWGLYRSDAGELVSVGFRSQRSFGLQWRISPCLHICR